MFWEKQNITIHQGILCSCDRASWQILIINPTRCTNFSNLFWNETLHASDRMSSNLYDIHHCCVYSEIPLWWTKELSEACRVSLQNKFEKLVHLVGCIIRNTSGVHAFSKNLGVASKYMVINKFSWLGDLAPGVWTPLTFVADYTYSIMMLQAITNNMNWPATYSIHHHHLKVFPQLYTVLSISNKTPSFVKQIIEHNSTLIHFFYSYNKSVRNNSVHIWKWILLTVKHIPYL